MHVAASYGSADVRKRSPDVANSGLLGGLLFSPLPTTTGPPHPPTVVVLPHSSQQLKTLNLALNRFGEPWLHEALKMEMQTPGLSTGSFRSRFPGSTRFGFL